MREKLFEVGNKKVVFNKKSRESEIFLLEDDFCWMCITISERFYNNKRNYARFVEKYLNEGVDAMSFAEIESFLYEKLYSSKEDLYREKGYEIAFSGEENFYMRKTKVTFIEFFYSNGVKVGRCLNSKVYNFKYGNCSFIIFYSLKHTYKYINDATIEEILSDAERYEWKFDLDSIMELDFTKKAGYYKLLNLDDIYLTLRVFDKQENRIRANIKDFIESKQFFNFTEQDKIVLLKAKLANLLPVISDIKEDGTLVWDVLEAAAFKDVYRI